MSQPTSGSAGAGQDRGASALQGPQVPEAHAERQVLRLLREAHERLAARAAALAPDESTRGSFCTDWSVAQVFSHLGSGAEIGATALSAAREGVPPPDPWQVWHVWDAKAPGAMVDDFAPADRAYLQALDQAVRAVEAGQSLLVPIDGRPWPLATAMTARLVEVALHEWDIAVAKDPSAEVDAAAATTILATFPLDVAAQGAAKAVVTRLAPRTVAIELLEPPVQLRLELLASGARLGEASGRADEADAVLTLPDAAAWVRLVSGRWRPKVDDARAQVTGDLAAEDLRQLFPGF
jgi:uncharacterized protein (TIGR03083 family)